MEQSSCYICQQSIDSKVEARFCASCGSAVHKDCSNSLHGQGAGMNCMKCGSNLQDTMGGTQCEPQAQGGERQLEEQPLSFLERCRAGGLGLVLLILLLAAAFALGYFNWSLPRIFSALWERRGKGDLKEIVLGVFFLIGFPLVVLLWPFLLLGVLVSLIRALIGIRDETTRWLVSGAYEKGFQPRISRVSRGGALYLVVSGLLGVAALIAMLLRR